MAHITAGQLASIAYEFWAASGVRTLERLDSLVDFYAKSYATFPETVADAKVLARKRAIFVRAVAK